MKTAKVAYITGGAQGIGRGISDYLLAHGWRVAVADIDAEAGQQYREMKKRQASGLTEEPAAPSEELAQRSAAPLGAQPAEDIGERLRVFTLDVRDEPSVAASLAATCEAFGRLDAVINNAAIADPFQGKLEELSLERWHQVLDTSLTSSFLTAKHAARHLRETGGSIVNLASSRALQSEPHSEAYAASKGGIVALTHAMAMSLGPEIRVNAVSPGWIDVSALQKSGEAESLSDEDHAQHPVGRVGHVDDIAALVAFLISDKAGFITGQNHVVDGGMTRKMVYAD
ncbi:MULTISPECIES: SDR family oxidoreductase [unclassified Cobetia]|uniref:SDR family oxidoreductase n=1 Tax=unclassified Cobetia TaxID=2609414 RepID=UPI00178CAB7A|nr:MULTISPECIES: SDR family oxidoreductase [unclassified Cobetia]MBE2167162.1 SDR family oxidoreductase [Cobetia sp. 2AS1]MDH2447393.1 SDR family oxidoreductase [Cobetia sp. 2AS]